MALSWWYARPIRQELSFELPLTSRDRADYRHILSKRKPKTQHKYKYSQRLGQQTIHETETWILQCLLTRRPWNGLQASKPASIHAKVLCRFPAPLLPNNLIQRVELSPELRASLDSFKWTDLRADVFKSRTVAVVWLRLANIQVWRAVGGKAIANVAYALNKTHSIANANSMLSARA